MSFLIAAHTDIGRRTMNQDAFCIKTAETPEGEVVLAALCDGMGEQMMETGLVNRPLAGWNCGLKRNFRF